MGCTAVKYWLTSLSVANRDGKKSMRDAIWHPCPKNNPEAGAMYVGPGFSHSFAGGRGSVVGGGEINSFAGGKGSVG